MGVGDSGAYGCRLLNVSVTECELVFMTGAEKSINGASRRETLSGILGRFRCNSILAARLDVGLGFLRGREPFCFFPCHASVAARLASMARALELTEEVVVMSPEDCRTNPLPRRLNGIDFFSFFSGEGLLWDFGRSARSLVARRDRS